ncbi:hypothetical protein EV385_2705 [Krasilnikovia cinnamomea]|uniref:Uncharacterized protein n=1 Tax=Krasilnikovia cinnamomea TaxID=349313 RepID=A0A4Q7ZKP9_9ACTN|nr:hypothetical protein EV385_2705 [Krasilnikovia cinnamomea]
MRAGARSSSPTPVRANQRPKRAARRATTGSGRDRPRSCRGWVSRGRSPESRWPGARADCHLRAGHRRGRGPWPAGRRGRAPRIAGRTGRGPWARSPASRWPGTGSAPPGRRRRCAPTPGAARPGAAPTRRVATGPRRGCPGTLRDHPGTGAHREARQPGRAGAPRGPRTASRRSGWRAAAGRRRSGRRVAPVPGQRRAEPEPARRRAEAEPEVARRQAGTTSARRRAGMPAARRVGTVPARRVGIVPARRVGIVPARRVGIVPARRAGSAPARPVGIVPARRAGSAPARRRGVLLDGRTAGSRRSRVGTSWRRTARLLRPTWPRPAVYRRAAPRTSYAPPPYLSPCRPRTRTRPPVVGPATGPNCPGRAVRGRRLREGAVAPVAPPAGHAG